MNFSLHFHNRVMTGHKMDIPAGNAVISRKGKYNIKGRKR